jgi:hypothetical protein
MSDEINVVNRTQTIFVEPSSSSVSIINAGAQGPAGPPGVAIYVGPTPPPTPAVNALWIDTS